MSDSFDLVLRWLQCERDMYQTKKFDYVEERDKDVDYWMQQFYSYLQRIPLFAIDTKQGAQAVLKLAATAVACAEHIAENQGSLPEPGYSSGELREWIV